MTVPKITMTLEEGLDEGARGAAFMLLVTNLSSNAKDWSSDVRGSASLSLQAAYFNKRFDVWEYLVEPLELENRQFQEWTMTAEVQLYFHILKLANYLHCLLLYIFNGTNGWFGQGLLWMDDLLIAVISEWCVLHVVVAKSGRILSEIIDCVCLPSNKIFQLRITFGITV